MNRGEMKIFFIIPPHIHYIEPYAYIEADKSNTVRPHLGLLYVAAVLKRDLGIQARIIDANTDNLTLNDLERIIAVEKPDIVGFSVLTFNLLNCLEICKIIRKQSPLTKICFGGWHPTLYPRETLELGYADYIVIGDGEYTFLELVSHCKEKRGDSGQRLNAIKGLGYKNKEGVAVVNPARKPVPDLNELPFPAYELVDIAKYSNLLACTGNSLAIITSRGCFQKCIFCDLRKTPYRFRNPDNILEEIKLWVGKNIREFFIQDDNFTISRKRTIEFCRLLIDSGLDIKYKISSRVDYLDDELLGYLKRSGCYRIYFGVESGSQKILDYLEKGISVEQIENVFRLAKKHRIDRFAYIMIGSYPESQKDIDKTLYLIKKIKPEHLHCSICTPMPKTYLYLKLLEDGFIKKDYWLEFAKNPDPAFKTPFFNQFFDSQRLRIMQSKIQRRFYLNPRVILQEMQKTQGLGQFLMKAKMAFRLFFK